MRHSRQAAGVLVYASDTGRYLLGLRSSRVSVPRTWSLIAGSCDHGELPRETTCRELVEETGYAGPIELHRLFVDQHAGVGFTGFIGTVPREFPPIANNETDAFRWCHLDEWPAPLHPGMTAMLADAGARAVLAKVAENTI